ncbi:MAG: 3-dehydroquinate synthase [Treponema sp.]|nr:3-dehydroquinate synthase [Treponema sp.]
MQNDLFTINYQKQYIATQKSEIYFFQDKIDLKKLFFSSGAGAPKCRRLFTLDTNVAALPCLKNFTALFCAQKQKPQAEASNGRGETARKSNCGLATGNTSGASPKSAAAKIKPGVYDGTGAAKGSALVIVKAGEKHKTIKTVLQIVEAALDRAFTRKDVFCAIGGGVLTDMTAFAAAIYKRGAVCEFIPTTLLAMVDAAMGGKTGCDFDDYKNMIGAFYPTRALYVFPEFVQSLSAEQYRSGFAEAFKTALLYDKKMFDEISKKRALVKSRDPAFVFKMIKACAKAKARVVQKDMTEKNIRMQLNLGHTFGHALETCAGLGKIAHGDAVAWGIGRALCLSQNLGLCSKEYRQSVAELLDYFGWESKAAPKCFCPKGGGQKLLEAMRRDKKNSSDKIRVILQRGLCETVIAEVNDKDILKCL